MRTGRWIRFVVGLLCLTLCAVWLRIESDRMVTSGTQIQFTVQGDPYYHMRRIAYTVARFPASLESDRYVSFPAGGQIAWTPAFDWSIAAVARAFVGPDDERAVERLAARVPAPLGVATVLAVAWLAGRTFSPAAGWIAGALLAVLPLHVLISQVGALDHHVAVALAWVGLLALAMALVRTPTPRSGRALGLGLGLGGGLLLWPGLMLHVVILEALLAVWVLRAGERSEAVARARATALTNGSAFLVLAPFCLGRTWAEYGSFTPWALSDFQPTFFAGAAVTLAATGVAWWRGRGATQIGRVAWAVGTGALMLALALALLPTLADALSTGAGWFAREEAFQQEVSELEPLSPSLAASYFSVLYFAFPLAWAWLAWRCLRERAGAEHWLVLGASAAWLGLAALQQRFGNDFSVLYVMVWGWFLADAVRRARVALAPRPRARLLAWAAAAAAAWFTLASLLAFHLPRQSKLAYARRQPAYAERGWHGLTDRLVSAAATWLGEHSPPTAGWLDPGAVPEYGVLCSWAVGHMVRYRARRPVVQDNFGVYGGRAQYEAAWRYFAAVDEDAAFALLRELRVRYVLADHQGAGTLRRYPPPTMAARLINGLGSLQAGLGYEIPALEHHRLIWYRHSGDGFEVSPQVPGFELGVFEIVAGARVVGRAAPGARVVARLPLRTESRRPHVHRAATRADEAGRFELILPYPTDRPFSSAVHAKGPWQLESAGRTVRLELAEDAVQSGATVAAPDLAPPVQDAS
jgi:asparagine N-glycosylation enzyme membrane subunit Stt3